MAHPSLHTSTSFLFLHADKFSDIKLITDINDWFEYDILLFNGNKWLNIKMYSANDTQLMHYSSRLVTLFKNINTYVLLHNKCIQFSDANAFYTVSLARCTG